MMNPRFSCPGCEGRPPPALRRRGRDWRPVKRPAWRPPPPAPRRWGDVICTSGSIVN